MGAPRFCFLFFFSPLLFFFFFFIYNKFSNKILIIYTGQLRPQELIIQFSAFFFFVTIIMLYTFFSGYLVRGMYHGGDVDGSAAFPWQ